MLHDWRQRDFHMGFLLEGGWILVMNGDHFPFPSTRPSAVLWRVQVSVRIG